jgi:hypothetical protein
MCLFPSSDSDQISYNADIIISREEYSSQGKVFLSIYLGFCNFLSDSLINAGISPGLRLETMFSSTTTS